VSTLITGGTGFLGSQLARVLVDRGEDVLLFDIHPSLERIKDIRDKVRVVPGNLAYWPEVMNVVKENRIKGIYHLGSMLSVPSQANPWASFQTNVCGTMHVLEAARLFDVEKVLFISSVSTYGYGVPRVVTDDSLQRPTSMYGSGKLYCELLGRFYRTKFGLDFRTFRSPTLVGPGVRTPGVTQYISLMIEYGTLGKPFVCNVARDTRNAGLMYFKDAVRALDLLYRASKEQIKTVNYNVSGLKGSLSAGELEEVVKNHVGDFSVTYQPDKEIVEYLEKYKTGMQVIEDANARAEWGWEPVYQDLNGLVADFVEEIRTRPDFFGIDQG
jgi:threonine 3-dehydrogenase